MKDPLISVIIPCYNHAHFLPAAIDSVLLQDWPNVQIIVVNDGSTDHTATVVAQQYPDVLLVSQANAGLSSARNKGLAVSAGEFVVFLDADDRLLASSLRAGFTCLQENPDSGFAWGCHQLRSENGITVKIPVSIPDAASHYEAMLQSNFIVMHAVVIYRRAVLLKQAGFNVSLKACEDYDLYLRITRNHDIAHHEHIVAEYRRHQSNMSYNSPMMLESALSVLHAQQPFTLGHARLESARQKGLARWRAFYGLRAVKRICQLLVGGRFKDAFADLSRLSDSIGLFRLLINLPGWLYRHSLQKLPGRNLVRKY